jgi:hypothetical protein
MEKKASRTMETVVERSPITITKPEKIGRSFYRASSFLKTRVAEKI